FNGFIWQGEPPDPASMETFLKSRLDWSKVGGSRQHSLLSFYQTLIRLRREHPALSNRSRDDMHVRGFEQRKLMLVGRKSGEYDLFGLYNFHTEDQAVDPLEMGIADACRKILDSADTKWSGPGSALPERIDGSQTLKIRASCVALYSKE
ncbi:MAG: DUF3459 domain-containing protein, partial [Syntrophobacteraceae bacterium]|nr:DUF3459 domain-containing protein [Syntrophobacteraceae bacterium]